VTGPWTNNWAGLDSVTADSSGMIQVSVPMFYRVRGFTGGTNPPPTDMVLIPAGSFIRGDTFGGPDSGEGDASELPTNAVTVSAFYMDKFEVTKTLWDTVYQWATNHGYSFELGALGKAADHPAHTMTWYDAVKWCNARSEKEGRTPAYYTNTAQTTVAVYRSEQVDVDNTWVKWNAGYRLPTEAEWERAARGGSNLHRFPWADADTITHFRANYLSMAVYAYDTSSTRGNHHDYDNPPYPYTSPVGVFAANGYGLYDMAGNVREWCWDWFSSTYYSPSPSTNPLGPTTGQFRVMRSSSWNDNAYTSRVANRGYEAPDSAYDFYGFRTVLPAGQ
jgi:formylglycine-generating enzyme required for sulfatase activity